ncbi:MAG TPA: YetF domain-containing protein [Daejeonella sp.]|nr:YetF domain-containing protein [Daejeonella sp.]
MNEIFEWNRFLFNDLPAKYLIEVGVRTLIMYIIVLTALRSSGKRGVKQLSIYELVLIIGLGSAAGDPMFYEDVGLIPAITVFAIIILLYRATTWLSGKSERFGQLLEGKAVCLIMNGKFSIENFKKEDLAQTEFFSELRQQSVEHLGQVRVGLIEPTGEISLFFFADKDVRPGLPLIPAVFKNKVTRITKEALYACTFCGQTQEIKKGVVKCKECNRNEWVEALSSTRIS